MAQKVLVTGGTGFIGSHTVVELQQAGFDVLIIDNLATSYESVLDGITRITGKWPEFFNFDLSDAHQTQAFFKAHHDIDAVIHFAAFKAVGESVQKPLKYYKNNLFSLVNLTACMEEHGIKHLVFSSSCTVYGEPDSLPVTEESPIKKAESPYGNTKQISEEVLEEQSRIGELCSIALRYFNPIGAHHSAYIGELPIGVPNNLVPFITQTAIGKRDSLTVFGDDYPTEDGTCIRDYIHVVDIAKAHVKSVERMLQGQQASKFEVFNLGTGRGNSVLEVINAFEEVNGLKLNYTIGPRRDGDVIQVYADTRKANEVLGWKAELDLKDMVATAWKWEQALANQAER